MLGGAVLANHAALGAVGMWPHSQMLGATLHRLADRAAVALTFDDGPDPAVTPRVLDLLAAAGARASFFCIGARARAHPGVVRRIAAAGHGVENHSLSHPTAFACLPLALLRREVGQAQAILADLAGRPPQWFRSPMGLRSPLLDPVLCRAGLHQASWSRRGYDTRCHDPALVLRRLARDPAAGDILLLHDGNGARGQGGSPVVLDVLPALLRRLQEAGLAVTALPAAMPGAAAAAASPASAGYAST